MTAILARLAIPLLTVASTVQANRSAIAQNWWPPKPLPGYNIFNVEQERWLAEKLARMEGLDTNHLDDMEATAFLQNVGARLVKQSKRPELEYAFFLQDDDDINACTAGGGQIYINSGLVGFCENEAELAYVIAHEIAHDALRHMPKTLSRWLSWGTGVDKIGDKADLEQRIEKLEEHLNQTGEFQIASDLLIGIRRGDELWADKYAVWNMYAAGYDPKAAVTMMDRLIKQLGDLPSPDSFEHLMELLFTTHPPSRDRVNLIELELIWMRTKPNTVLDTEEFRAVRRRMLTGSNTPKPARSGQEHGQRGVFVGAWKFDVGDKLESRRGN